MRMIYLQLYLSFLQVGLFSVGGGYAAMPLIRSQVVELHPWMTLQEFTNLITIAEMTPGPIAVNCATFVGLRIAQLPGAVIATLGCITPALVLVSLLAWCYRRWRDLSVLQSVLACLRPVVVALILGAGLSILGIVVFPNGMLMVNKEAQQNRTRTVSPAAIPSKANYRQRHSGTAASQTDDGCPQF